MSHQVKRPQRPDNLYENVIDYLEQETSCDPQNILETCSEDNEEDVLDRFFDNNGNLVYNLETPETKYTESSVRENGYLTETGQHLARTTLELAEYLMRQEEYHYGDNNVVLSVSGGYTLGAKPDEPGMLEDLEPYLTETANLYNQVTRENGRYWTALKTLADEEYPATVPEVVSDKAGLDVVETGKLLDRWEDHGLILDRDKAVLPESFLSRPGISRKDKVVSPKAVVISPKGRLVYEKLSPQLEP